MAVFAPIPPDWFVRAGQVAIHALRPTASTLKTNAKGDSSHRIPLAAMVCFDRVKLGKPSPHPRSLTPKYFITQRRNATLQQLFRVRRLSPS
jgi:hypothetical protein